jgi:two-component system sensor histidine kinase VicK
MARLRERLRRPRLLAGIQGRMTAMFLLLTLLAMQVIGAGLLYRLRAFYLDTSRASLAAVAAGMAAEAEALLQGGMGLAQVGSDVAGSLASPATGAVILNPAGRVVYATGLPEVVAGMPFRPAAGLASAAAGRPATALVRTAAGTTEIWAAAPVEVPGRGLQGLVFVESSASPIYAVIVRVRSILLTWTLLALGLAGLLSFVFARTVTGPIEELTARARAMAAGDFAGRIPVRGRDEVGELARVFNRLARRLQETLDEIRGEERRLAAILTNMTDGLLALDGQGRVLLCNPAAGTLLGLEPEAARGRAAEEVLPGPLLEALSARGAGAAPAPGAPLAWRGRHLRVHVAPLVEDPAAPGAVVVLQDVTAQERLEAMRKEFVANVTHDLRTPLTTIRLYAETLLDWALREPELARSKLEVIADETDRMARLIDDLLELSRLDAQGAVRERRPVDLGLLAARVVERFAERARQKEIAVSLEAPGEPAVVLADGDRIERVLTNLLDNAVEFTDPGGRVWVAVTPRDGEVEVTVRDTGIGIPPGELERIFDRFYRVDPSRSRESGGSGLGLAIAREIVEGHGGRIAAESAGRGSTFRFTLPREAMRP